MFFFTNSALQRQRQGCKAEKCPIKTACTYLPGTKILCSILTQNEDLCWWRCRRFGIWSIKKDSLFAYNAEAGLLLIYIARCWHFISFFLHILDDVPDKNKNIRQKLTKVELIFKALIRSISCIHWNKIYVRVCYFFHQQRFFFHCSCWKRTKGLFLLNKEQSFFHLGAFKQATRDGSD